MLFVGIDPGASGGIAVIQDDSRVVYFQAVPKFEYAVPFCLRAAIGDVGINRTRIVIEKVTGYTASKKEGKNRQPGSRMFNFGRNVGVWIGCIHTLGFSKCLKEVAAVTWQKELGLKGPPGEEYYQRKKRLKIAAQKLFPSKIVTGQTADALLLALYAKQTYGEVGK